jgi:hypothetical protein
LTYPSEEGEDPNEPSYDDENDAHPAFSPLSDEENIVWLIFELVVQTM